MQIYFITVFMFSLLMVFAFDLMPELKRNVLNFGYGVNFKYEEMSIHSFNRFYVVTNIKYLR